MLQRIGFVNRNDSVTIQFQLELPVDYRQHILKDLIIPRYSTVDILDRYKV